MYEIQFQEFIMNPNLCRGGSTASRDTRAGLLLQIQSAIVKSSACLSTVKVGYHFDVLRNESALTDKSSEHLVTPSLSECTCPLLTFVFKFDPETGACAGHKETFS